MKVRSSGKVDTAQEDAIAGTEDNAQVDLFYLPDFTTAVTHGMVVASPALIAIVFQLTI